MQPLFRYSHNYAYEAWKYQAIAWQWQLGEFRETIAGKILLLALLVSLGARAISLFWQ